MKLWLDDIRIPPDESWTWVTTAQGAIDLLKKGNVQIVSLDHDLNDAHYAGYNEKVEATGYEVAKFIEEAIFNNLIPMPIWYCHSMNPVGRQRIISAMKNAQDINSRRAR